MSGVITNITDLTKIYTFDTVLDYLAWVNSDEYYEYGLVVVGPGTITNPPDPITEEDLTINELYYGTRRVSDLIVTRVIPNDGIYPNNKIYLVPYPSDGIGWILPGQSTASRPTGYQLYFKYNDVVTPIFNSVIAGLTYDEVQNTVTIRFNTQDGPVDYTIPQTSLKWQAI